MASLSQINIRFNADLKQFSTQMQNAQRKLGAFGGKLQSTGKALSIGLTLPIVALGAKSVIAFDKQAKAIAQVDAGLKSTGNTANKTLGQLVKGAEELQNTSLFGDEEILKDVTAQLLTFTNIANKQFDRTQLAALNLATRLDGDLKSASIQLGKALNDPVANLSALSRSGIQFSKEQKEVISSLVETNRLADAQTIILDELEKQYGGAAAAAAAAGLGPLKQLSNILGDITEDFGKIITEAITPFIQRLKGLALGFKNLDDGTKKVIAVVLALVAALGPLLASLGFFISTILPALATGFAALTGPIGLVVLGVGALVAVIANNWDEILGYLKETRQYFIDLYADVELVRVIVNQLVFEFKVGFGIIKAAAEILFKSLGVALRTFVTQIGNVGAAFKSLLQGDFSGVFDAVNKSVGDSVVGFSELIKILNTGGGGKLADGLTKISAAAQRAKIEVAALNTELDKPKGSGRGSVESVGSVAAQGPIFGDGIDGEFAALAGPIDAATERITAFQAAAFEVGAAVSGVFSNMAGSLVNSLGLADDGFEGFAKGLASTVSDLITILLSSSIAQAIAGATASGTATGPLAVFSTPAFISTAVGGVLAAFASIPKLAQGGLASRETLALIGDNRNAAFDPEVVSPLSKLRDFIDPSGGMQDVNVFVTGDISGDSIKLAVDRVIKKQNRRG